MYFTFKQLNTPEVTNLREVIRVNLGEPQEVVEVAEPVDFEDLFSEEITEELNMRTRFIEGHHDLVSHYGEDYFPSYRSWGAWVLIHEFQQAHEQEAHAWFFDQEDFIFLPHGENHGYSDCYACGGIDPKCHNCGEEHRFDDEGDHHWLDSLSQASWVDDPMDLYYEELPERREVAQQILFLEGGTDIRDINIMMERNTLVELSNELKDLEFRRDCMIEAILRGIMELKEVPEVFKKLDHFSIVELQELNASIPKLVELESADEADLLEAKYDPRVGRYAA